MNVVILLGRLGADPDVRYTSNDMCICKFRLATSKKVKGEEKTEWHSIVAFGKQGEILGKHVHKGSQVMVRGEIRYREHEGKWYTDIALQDFQFVGGSRQPNQAANTRPDGRGFEPAGPDLGDGDNGLQHRGQELRDDDIPF